jgi:D-alanyl-lipoteichoic acid acyltransferase DltB (MBOAT superfamily)
MSYTIEVYRGNQRPERHFGVYALYVMFYPQLVAGPIERPQNVLHQLRERHAFSAEACAAGLRLMLLGFVKKVVIADRIAVLVDRVYDAPQRYPAPVLALATGLFAFQIYADFAGYSDIALGAARVMGVRLMTNFERPYMARSISEFWRRWHISLSTWFRDYVYLPLGGNRRGFARTQLNLLATFAISGLWHGANWTFVIWGTLNGLYLVAANVTTTVRARAARRLGLDRAPRLHAALARVWTFALVTFAWTFFRARSLADARCVVRTVALESWRYHTPGALRTALATVDLPRPEIVGAVAAAAALFVFDYAVERRADAARWLAARPAAVRWAVYYAAVAALLAFGRFGLQQFIYFQF